MRRRRLLTLLALSTFLIALLWTVSVWYRWSWASTPAGPQRHQFYFCVGNGSLKFVAIWREPSPRSWRCDPGMDYRLFNGFDRTNLAGTHWRPYIGSYSGTPQSCFSVNLPLWLPLLPLAVTLTVLWARRRDPAACARCGYLLRGLPSRTCPECGHKNKYTIVCVAQWFTQRRRRAASIHSCGAIVPVSSAMTSGWQ